MLMFFCRNKFVCFCLMLFYHFAWLLFFAFNLCDLHVFETSEIASGWNLKRFYLSMVIFRFDLIVLFF